MSFFQNFASMKGCSNIGKPTIQKISQCVIKPKHVPTESQKNYYLTPWGLSLISIEYGQGGLLFQKPHNFTTQTILELLKDSLSTTLSYYLILAGRLETTKTSDAPSAYSIFINCSDCPGAEFVYAAAKEVNISDITSPDKDIVESFFPFTEQVPRNHEGHTKPLLYVQVTELADGIFLGCAANHSAIDGSSYWHFLHTWSEISSKMANENDSTIAHPPIFTPWSMENHGPILNLPSSFIEEMRKDPPSISSPPLLRNRIFKLPAKSLVELKAQAIAESKNSDKKISSFQALNAFLWRCITRARHLPSDRKTTCILAADNRAKLQPPLCKDNIGCYVKGIGGTTTAGELLANNLGWSASILHEAVINHTSEEISTWLKDWIEAPSIFQIFGENFVVAENSPRFEVYNDDFGWGKPVSVSIGRGNKTDGTMFFHQSRGGGGNIDIELNLYPEFMNAILLDPEFVNRVYC